MPEISLTDFVDFVIKSGSPKLTQVRKVKERPEYSRAFDFWKPLRKAIVDFHKTGGKKQHLDEVLVGLDKKKVKRYVSAIAGYKKFLGAKSIVWFNPPSQIWNHGGLDVRVNPEIGLKIGNEFHVIKLYFKDEQPTVQRLHVVHAMMHDALDVLRPSNMPEWHMSVLDVSSAKLNPCKNLPNDIRALLQGEATAFVSIWKAI